MRLLCISDIHGHVGALSAVLAMAERHSFHKLLVAGDIVFPGPEPLETWRRLTTAGAVMVQGVADKAVATLEAEQLVRGRTGIPFTIMRPSIVVGDRNSGWTYAFNVLYWPLRAFAVRR